MFEESFFRKVDGQDVVAGCIENARRSVLSVTGELPAKHQRDMA